MVKYAFVTAGLVLSSATATPYSPLPSTPSISSIPECQNTGDRMNRPWTRSEKDACLERLQELIEGAGNPYLALPADLSDNQEAATLWLNALSDVGLDTANPNSQTAAHDSPDKHFRARNLVIENHSVDAISSAFRTRNIVPRKQAGPHGNPEYTPLPVPLSTTLTTSTITITTLRYPPATTAAADPFAVLHAINTPPPCIKSPGSVESSFPHECDVQARSPATHTIDIKQIDATHVVLDGVPCAVKNPVKDRATGFLSGTLECQTKGTVTVLSVRQVDKRTVVLDNVPGKGQVLCTITEGREVGGLFEGKMDCHIVSNMAARDVNTVIIDFN